MEAIYQLCNTTRQSHHKSKIKQINELNKAPLYLRNMDEIRNIHPGMGVRAMYELLMPEGIGRDSFISLGLSNGFRLKSIEKYTRTTYSTKSNRYKNLLGNIVFTSINQIWTSDITYFAVGEKFYYIVLIMDVYSRYIVGYNVADNMRAENNVYALEMALKFRGIKDYNNTLIHHSDKGTQYASDAYTALLEKYKIQISMCNEVYENTHIERLNDTIKNQYLARMNITKPSQIKPALKKVAHNYNFLRPHMSLDKLTPNKFEEELVNTSLDRRKKLTIFTCKEGQTINDHIQGTLF